MRHYHCGFASLAVVKHEVLAIFVVAIVKHDGIGRHTLLEVAEILARFGCPATFGHSYETRQSEPFQIVGVRHVFAPESALHTVCGGAGDSLVVSSLYIVGTRACTRRVGGTIALTAVDVVGSPGGVDAWHAKFLSLINSGFGACPTVYYRTSRLHDVGVGTSCSDAFVPNGQMAAFRLDKFVKLLNEVALQLTVISQFEFLVQCLAFGIFLPSISGAFIATNVNVLAGEEFHEFL